MWDQNKETVLAFTVFVFVSCINTALFCFVLFSVEHNSQPIACLLVYTCKTGGNNRNIYTRSVLKIRHWNASGRHLAGTVQNEKKTFNNSLKTCTYTRYSYLSHSFTYCLHIKIKTNNRKTTHWDTKNDIWNHWTWDKTEIDWQPTNNHGTNYENSTS